MRCPNPTAAELLSQYQDLAVSAFAVSQVVLAAHATQALQLMNPGYLFTTAGDALMSKDAPIDQAGIAGGSASDGARPRYALDAGVLWHLSMGQAEIEAGADGFEGVLITYVASSDAPRLAPLTGFDWSFSPTDLPAKATRAHELAELGRSALLEDRLNQIIGATAFIKGLWGEDDASKTKEGIRRARAYMDAHFMEDLTLPQLGNIAGVTPKHFSERFEAAYGTRPKAYVIELRLQRADELLRTSMPIKDIARAVGYDDPLYFSRIYRKYRGVSPTQTRERSVAFAHRTPPGASSCSYD